jgi:hypothetical protein
MHQTLLLSCTSDEIQIAATFSGLGILSHQLILTGEIDSAVGSLLVGSFLTWAGLATSFAKVLDLDIIVAIAKSALACLSFLVGLGASIVVYRLFFHPLRHFPGRWGAKISRFYTVWITKTSDFMYHHELERLHAEFGDFVRTGSSRGYISSRGSNRN